MKPRVRHRRRTKNRLPSILILTLILAGAGFYFWRNNVTGEQSLSNKDIPASVSTNGSYWAKADEPYRHKLNIDMSKGTNVEFSFNHAEWVVNSQSFPTAKDLVLVAQISNASEEIPFTLSNPNSNSTTIRFNAGKYKDAGYYLYHGRRHEVTTAVLGSAVINTNNLNKTNNASMELPLLSLSSPRNWYLRTTKGVAVELNTKIDGALNSQDTEMFYVISSDQRLNPISLPASDGKVKFDLPADTTTGDVELYLVLKQDQRIVRSNSVLLKVSDPMYVAWTIDWEGYNPKDSVLNDFIRIAGQYKLPVTHFFNPRIYIDPNTPAYRRGQLTNWIKERASKGDEIAMHMHMHYDMVQAAGVTAQRSPRWGYGLDGYDVLTSNYSYDDFNKIVDWALGKFKENGLPEPKGYRAGGWFADLDTLRVLNDKGFVYDASGRENYAFGKNKQPGTWNLSFTAQPYQPSMQDQNSSEPAPRMRLWEMPNNGNDSYWFSAEDMISRFYMNYKPGEVLAEQKLVTYLSHPDWFDVDKPKLDKLFTEIAKYNYSEDKGPVVYTTLSNALQDWQ